MKFEETGRYAYAFDPYMEVRVLSVHGNRRRQLRMVVEDSNGDLSFHTLEGADALGRASHHLVPLQPDDVIREFIE